MEMTEDAEEALEVLWLSIVEGGKKRMKNSGIGKPPVVWELAGRGLIESDKKYSKLTKAGKAAARDVIRRHRLAERLFHDLIKIDIEEMETPACQFEHMLISGGVEEGVCTLLGHPRECPHGRKIPPGRCCKEKRQRAEKVIHPLSEVKKGAKVKVVYIRTEDHGKLQKLMAMGVLPGRTIKLIQRSPSYVFQIGGSQVAVDKEIASEILVRLGED